MSLKFASLEVTDSRTAFHKKYDLGTELVLKQSEAILLLQNLLNFSTIPFKSTLEIITELRVGDINVRIYKSYATGDIKYFVNEQEQSLDIYQWMSQQTGLKLDPPTWERRLVDFRTLELNSKEEVANVLASKDSALQIDESILGQKEAITAQFEQLKAELTKGLPPDQVQKLERLRDIKTRVAKVQIEVDSYQSSKDGKETLDKKIAEKQMEFNNINDKLASVSSLLASKTQTEQELQKFNTQTQNQDLSNLRAEKFSETDKFLQTAYTKPSRSVAASEEPEKGFELTTKKILLIAQIPVTLILLIGVYLLLMQDAILVLGFVILLIEFFVLISQFHKKNEPALEVITEQEVPQVQSIQNFSNASNDKMFINQAWKVAYQEELVRIDQLISSNLNNKTYEEAESEKSQKESELNALKSELENLENGAMDPESYYKKRRELDILKIEKENLEFGGNVNLPGGEQLDALSQQLSEIDKKIYTAEKLKAQIPVIAINVKESIKSFINELDKRRQIILINNEK